MTHSSTPVFESLPRLIERYKALLELLEREFNSADLLDGFVVSPERILRRDVVMAEIEHIPSYVSDADKVARYHWATNQLTRLLRQIEGEELRFIRQRAWTLRRRIYDLRRTLISAQAQPHVRLLAQECRSWINDFVRKADDPRATLAELRPKLVGITTRINQIAEKL